MSPAPESSVTRYTLDGKVEVIPAMRNGLRGQSYVVSREYAEILVRDNRAYWDHLNACRIYEFPGGRRA